MLRASNTSIDKDQVEAMAHQTCGQQVDTVRQVNVHLLDRDPPV